jgi:hypothetical protein
MNVGWQDLEWGFARSAGLLADSGRLPRLDLDSLNA